MSDPAPARRTLHVAAMPFPSPQGTQAAVRAMVDVLASDGRETHLLTYGHGRGSPGPTTFEWHRLPVLPGTRSMRSGPSPAKVALDLHMVATVRRLAARLTPDLIVAHHVEACAVALAAGTAPVLFVAHTALEPELPSYFHPALGPVMASAGAALDRWLARRADSVAAIAPALADRLETEGRSAVTPLPLPWTLPPPISDTERRRTRRELGLSPRTPVASYAGNLDAYQGWDWLIDALPQVARVRPEARLLVATQADPRALRRRARHHGVLGRVRILPLADETDRRRVHAATDLALVPRRAPGGLPVKLLDALARGVPTLATRRATAGLPLDPVAEIVVDDDPHALATAWVRSCVPGTSAKARGVAGRDHIGSAHGGRSFLQAFDRAASRSPGGR